MGLLSILLGKRPSLKCKNCGKKGSMFMEKGAVNKGQFKTHGKDENAMLIVECISCKVTFSYNPITGRMYDELDKAAKEMGVKVD